MDKKYRLATWVREVDRAYVHRRTFLKGVAFTVAASAYGQATDVQGDDQRELPSFLIVDTHQHLWDLGWQKLPWLENAPAVLRKNYLPVDYQQAVEGCNVQAIYMEVDVAEEQLQREAEHVVQLIRNHVGLTRAAVVGARPAAAMFGEYLARIRRMPEVKGVRQVLHVASTPPGFCLSKEFQRGIRKLGEAGLSFELCMRPGELEDAVRLVSECSETQFVLDHCGNADPMAFSKKPARQPEHDADAWRRAIERLAARANVICKISGIVARVGAEWGPDDLAPIVLHCWDCFGPDRVVFGGDWPVCLLGAPLRSWIAALHAITRSRPEEHQRKLWSENARRFYRLSGG
ncbi:MAG: amidohydrolase [Pirellulaceae bacterium]|nr:MAG: amidohydrolase [Pirellulaceae bacterium]